MPAVDDRWTYGSSADGVDKADGRTAERHRSDGKSTDRHTEADGRAADGDENAE